MRRAGFTLLEMVLAMSIGVVLLGAIYLAMDSQLRLVDAGRDVLDEAAIARAVFSRIQLDINACLGARDPRLLPDMATDTDDETDASSGTTGSSGSTSSSSSPSSSSSTKSSASSTTTIVNSTKMFNYGVRGDGATLELSASRVPRELVGRDKLQANVNSLPKVSDLRRIQYWYVDGKGLARRETSNPTGDDVNLAPGDLADPTPYLFAPEVQSMTIEYFDGVSSQATWDSSTVDFETEVPVGPPAAVVIELKIGVPNGVARVWRQTIAVPTSNNFPRSGG